MRTLSYCIAVTQDGYIAGPDGEVDAFEYGPELMGHLIEHYPETLPTPARAQLGIDGPNRRFDAVVMGRHTYDVGRNQGMTSPYGHLEQVVVSSTLETDIDDEVRVATQDPVTVVRELKAGSGLGVWLCGGGVLAGALIDEIDELILKRQPIALGAGRPLFVAPYGPRRFELSEQVDVGPLSIETYHRSPS